MASDQRSVVGNSKFETWNLELHQQRLQALARAEGMDVFGIADVSFLWQEQIHVQPKEAFRQLARGIVMGHRLSKAVLQSVVDGPTLLYKHHYQRVNLLLDRAALRVASNIQSWGYEALPIAASQVIDWERLLGHLSHRSVGALAGVGWIGRSNLLVHPAFGAQVRYVTVLTSLPLPPGQPVVAQGFSPAPSSQADLKVCATSGEPPQLDCGECRSCIEVCPAKAIGERKEGFQVQLCYEKLKKFSSMPGMGVHICGLCVKVCDGSGR